MRCATGQAERTEMEHSEVSSNQQTTYNVLAQVAEGLERAVLDVVGSRAHVLEQHTNELLPLLALELNDADLGTCQCGSMASLSDSCVQRSQDLSERQR